MNQATHAERFAAYLRALKARSGRGFDQLGKQAGVSGSSFHRYCSGSSVPADYRVAHAVARACGASQEEMRTVHRLWALADASRETRAAVPVEPVSSNRASEPGLHGGDGEVRRAAAPATFRRYWLSLGLLMGAAWLLRPRTARSGGRHAQRA